MHKRFWITFLLVGATFFLAACQQDSDVSSKSQEPAAEPVDAEVNEHSTSASTMPSYRFERVGKALMPNQDQELMDNIAYSKLSPWPYTDGTVFYTGCYDPTRVNYDEPWSDRCFAVVDISDPVKPVRVATVPGYDPELSPSPPQGHIVWEDSYPFPDLPTQAPCFVEWDDPEIANAERAPECWDPGWNTHTHYVSKGPNGLLAVNQESYRLGTHRQHNYRGVKFYDVSDPTNPEFVSYWEAPASPFDHEADKYPDMHGVHHFNFEDNYLMLGGEYEGYIGKIFITLDLSDPANPVEVSKFHLPGQKTPEEDHLRYWEQSPKFNFPVVQLENGKWSKYYGMHYVSIDNDRAYLSYHQAGLVILDVSDKANPQLLSHTNYIMPDAQLNSPDREACIASGGGVPTACGNAHSAKVLPTNPNILIMTDEYFTCPFGHMRIFDVEDPTQPKILSQVLLPETTDCDPDNPTKAVNASRYPNRGPSTHIGNYFGGELEDIYVVAWYGAGVRALDLSDVTNPKIVAEYQYSIADDFPHIDPEVTNKLIGQDTYDVIQGPDGYLYVSDGSAGLRVVKLIKE